jgi:hypothetical protein
MVFSDTDDFFEVQYKENELKKQKKLAKQERLNRKKILIDEIKEAHGKMQTLPEKGSIEWAYQLLNVDKSSTFSEMKKNYLKLAQKFHPDKNNGQDIQEMKDLNGAWDLIKKTL